VLAVAMACAASRRLTCHHQAVTATENVPCEPSLFPVLLEHAAQYSDLDPSRRIGRDTLVRWFEDARVQLGREALAADLADRAQGLVRLRVVAVRVDVLAPLRIAGDYRIGIGVSRVGTSSVSYRYGVFAGDECVATGESTSVYLGDDGTAPLPDDLREQLGRHRIAGPEAPAPERVSARPREAYPFRLDVRTRFGDLDTNRHVNNVRLATWYLDGLAELHLDVLGYPVGGPLDGLAPSSLAVQYLGEVHYPGIYQLRVAVVGIDDDIVRYACGLFDGPTCVGLAEAVGSCHVEGSDGKPVDLKAALEPFGLRG
jgi:acyl-CoA thioester hydrolase